MRETFRGKSEPMRQPLGTRSVQVLLHCGKTERDGGAMRFAVLLTLVGVFPPENISVYKSLYIVPGIVTETLKSNHRQFGLLD